MKDQVKASDLLETAMSHLIERGVTYDNASGERSIGKTVDAFNAIHGTALTEEQGWSFMMLLKQVRATQGEFKLDSYEDGAAYFALMGEAAAKSSCGENELTQTFEVPLSSIMKGASKEAPLCKSYTITFNGQDVDALYSPSARELAGDLEEARLEARDKCSDKQHCPNCEFLNQCYNKAEVEELAKEDANRIVELVKAAFEDSDEEDEFTNYDPSTDPIVAESGLEIYVLGDWKEVSALELIKDTVDEHALSSSEPLGNTLRNKIVETGMFSEVSTYFDAMAGKFIVHFPD